MTSMFALWASTLLALGGPVTEVAITPMASQTSILISIDGTVEYRDFVMEGPHRLVVDLMGARHALPMAEFGAVNRGGIRSIRSSQYSADVVRVVFVLDQRLGYTLIPDPRGPLRGRGLVHCEAFQRILPAVESNLILPPEHGGSL